MIFEKVHLFLACNWQDFLIRDRFPLEFRLFHRILFSINRFKILRKFHFPGFRSQLFVELDAGC